MRLKNEVLVGVVAFLGLGLLLVGALWLSGEPWGEEQAELVGIFRGVGELREGSPVKYRGVQVGRVVQIELSPAGDGVLVSMEVPPTLELPPGPAVVLAPASLFGDWQASLISMPTQPDLEFTRAQDPQILPGAALPDITELTAVGARIANDIETLAGRVELAFTEETALKIRQTIDNIQQTSERLEGFVAEETAVLDQVAQNALVASRNVEQTTARVEQVATRVEQSLDAGELEAIITNVRLATENLQQLTAALDTVAQEVPGIREQVQNTLGSVQQLVENLEPAVAEVGPTLREAREAVGTLQRAAARIEQGEGTLGRLLEDPALYEETQRAITSLQRLLADLQANPGKYIGAVEIFE